MIMFACNEAKEKWEQAADAQLEARRRWNEEEYEVKSKIATLMAKRRITIIKN